MLAVIGMAGITVDLGHGYLAYQRLAASTKAAALAGAAGLPNTTTALSNITAYSSVAGSKNVTTMLQNASVGTPTFKCLSTLATSIGIACATTTGSNVGSYNAVQVTQTAQVPLWFGGMFGLHNFNLSATSTAAMSGGTNSPWNVAIIVDTTASMASSDSGLQCSGTQISCALAGVQDLLQDMYPCPLGTTCTAASGQMVQNPVDSVSLFVFPAVTTATQSKDYTCPTSNPTTIPYTVPTLPSTATYQVIPFSSNYRVSDAATTLNSSSEVVIAAGGKSSCAGIQAPGGQGTYYAQVIYAAQAALVTQQASNTGSQNAMIILTDGNATASGSQLAASSTGSLNGISGHNPTSYTYPSAVGECGQAVQAAMAAAAAGTRVYTIGYGSPTSGCTTDKTYSGTYTGGGGNWTHGDSPCQALAAMASGTAYFFSDDGAGCASTNGTNFTKLTQIFQAISKNLTTPRLVPNSTT
jgi:Flp pilus assembly protein TadG